MPRLDRLPRILRSTLLTFPAQVNDTAPFAPLQMPLSACRLAMVTTAGLHVRGDTPFIGGDPTFRIIPSNISAADVLQSHISLGFDRTPIIRDLNVTFPIDRLRELASGGQIGGLAPNFYSIMGAMRETSRIEKETGPAIAEHLRSERADAALITPT